MLVAEKMMVQGFHYPFPAVCLCRKTGTGYREIPVVWNGALVVNDLQPSAPMANGTLSIG